MKNLIFHPDAEVEAAVAADFYENQQPHLGTQFLCAIEDGAARVKADPLLYPFVQGDVRRCLVRTFPFAIFFRVIGSDVVILAVSHLKRKPMYWKQRIV